MFEAEPIVAIQFEPRSGRTEIAAALAAGVVAQARRRQGFGCENGICRLAPHGSSMGALPPPDKARHAAPGARRATQTRIAPHAGLNRAAPGGSIQH